MHKLNNEAKTAYKSKEIIWLYMGLLLITKYLITTSKSLFLGIYTLVPCLQVDKSMVHYITETEL